MNFIRIMLAALSVLSTLFGNPKLEDVRYAIFENGIEVQMAYSNPISDDDIIAWKTERGRMVITLLGVSAGGTLEPSSFFNDPLTSMFIDDLDGSAQLSFTLRRPILGYDVYQGDALSHTSFYIHLAESNHHVKSLKSDTHPESQNTELNVGFPEYFEVELTEAMAWARKDLGDNSLFKYYGDVKKTSRQPTVYLSAIESSLPINSDSFVKPSENQSMATSTNPIPEPIPTQPSPKIETDWIQIFNPDDALYPPEVINESQNIILLPQDEPSARSKIRQPHSSKENSHQDYTVQNESIIKKWTQTKQRFGVRATAGIKIKSNFDGYPIYLDGKLVGETPISHTVRVNPGWHQVSGLSPVYAHIIKEIGLDTLGDDPLTRNNQLFGTKVVYVEKGKVVDVFMKFNSVSGQPKKRTQIDGGMVIGLPVILALFGFITWGLI